MWESPLGLVWVVVLFGGAAILAARLDPLPPPVTGKAYALDGDTLRLGSTRVRLLGIDAPELKQSCFDTSGKEWPCGEAARTRLAELAGAGTLHCEPRGHDKYGRTLATCRGNSDLGKAMVEEGLAVSYDDYPVEELAARAAGKGIWAGRFQMPRSFRDEGEAADSGPSLLDDLWTWFRQLTGATSLR